MRSRCETFEPFEVSVDAAAFSAVPTPTLSLSLSVRRNRPCARGFSQPRCALITENGCRESAVVRSLRAGLHSPGQRSTAKPEQEAKRQSKQPSQGSFSAVSNQLFTSIYDEVFFGILKAPAEVYIIYSL